MLFTLAAIALLMSATIHRVLAVQGAAAVARGLHHLHQPHANSSRLLEALVSHSSP